MENYTPPEEVENVRVVARVRPLSSKEIERGFNNIVTVNRINGTISVKNPKGNSQELPKVFVFDVVFDTDSSQMDVYNETARPVIEKVLAGYNGTILAYGQTGTGKTFTMEGINTKPELRGIIPNSFAHIFGQIAKAKDDTNFLVRVSYYEIYNEEIRDLLSKNNEILEVKERPGVGTFIKNLSTYVVNNADDMERIMTLGNRRRIVQATAMNDESSRAHGIFTITIETSEKMSEEEQHVKVGRLHLVDLAGSERQRKTGSTGLRLKEATKINLSLCSLGLVVSALVDGKCTHIPYRNSKLTRLLQDSLGGNSKTVMCATIGPADDNYDETISTLRYASKAKKICNKARVNENPKDALLREFQMEIIALKKQLEEKQLEKVVSDVEEESTEEEEEEIEQNKKQDETLVLKELKDKELEKAQKEEAVLKEKLENLERKILVGGENLLEKAEEQEHLLEASAKELELRIVRENELRNQLEEKEAERLDMEEKYSSLQDEALGLTRKIRKLTALISAAKEELKDLRQDNQREMEGLLDSIRQLAKELALQEAIEKLYIPETYRELIEKHAHWNEDIGEWELKCVAYTGNNMRKSWPPEEITTHTAEIPVPDLSKCYLSYSNDRAGTAKHRTKSARAFSSRQ